MIYVLGALLCSLLFAGVTIAGKMLAGTVPAFAFAFVRYGLAALCLLPFLLLRKEKEKLKIRDLPILLFLGFALVLLFNGFFFTALYYTSAISVALISATNPIFTMILSAIIYRHIPNRYQLLAFMLSFMGTALVITNGKMGFSVLTGSIGELLALIAVICQIFYTLALKKVSTHYSPLFLSVATLVSGVLFVFPFVANKAFVQAMINLSPLQLGLFAFISFFGTALAIVLYSTSVKHMGPARTSLTIFSTMPIFVFVLAFVLLGEKVTIWQLLGGILVVSSLVVGLRHTR